MLIFLHLAGSTHKARIGIIVRIIVALVIILFFGGLLFWFKVKHKGFKREVFVDVAGLSSVFSL